MPQHVRVDPEDVSKRLPTDRGLAQSSEVKAEQILTISRDRLQGRIGVLGERKMTQVDSALRISLSL